MARSVLFWWPLIGCIVLNVCTKVLSNARDDNIKPVQGQISGDVKMKLPDGQNANTAPRSKRFTYESDNLDDERNFYPGIPEGAGIAYAGIPYGLAGYDFPDDVMDSPEVDKRQMSRWNHIHSMLQKARAKSSNSKRSESAGMIDRYNFNVNKRQNGRWKYINWMLNKVKQKNAS